MDRHGAIPGLGSILFVLIFAACTPPASQPKGPTFAATVVAETGNRQWDLVLFGDSDMWGSFHYYSKYFEEDLGVTITVHQEDKMAMASTYWLQTLREDKALRKLLAEAEIITFNIPLVFPMMQGACFNSTLSFEKDGCFSESETVYAENTRGIIREIKSLVGKKGALIRLQNGYVPVNWWLADAMLKDRAWACVDCFAKYWQAEARVAAEEGIPVVDIFSAYHGPNHDQNPADSGLVGEDGIHGSDKGDIATADLYRKAGYEFWRP